MTTITGCEVQVQGAVLVCSTAWSDLGAGKSFLHKAEGHSSVRGPEVPVSGGRAGVWYQIIRLQSFCSAHGTTCHPIISMGVTISDLDHTPSRENPRLCIETLGECIPSVPGAASSKRVKGLSLPVLIFSKLSNQYLGSISLYRTGVDTPTLRPLLFK